MSDTSSQTNLSTYQEPPQNAATLILDPSAMKAMTDLAILMASGKTSLPAHFRGNAADCMAIVLQAMQWGMNPFAVAQKTFIVNGGALSYEAQLVNAVITSKAPTIDRLNYEWFGPWEKIVGKFIVKTNNENKEYRVPGWKLIDETGCGVRVWATFKGEEKPRELETLMAQARTRNSTLWADDPKQQIAYLATKKWARLFCPDVILGVYTPDEFEDNVRTSEIDITPPGTVDGGGELVDMGISIISGQPFGPKATDADTAKVFKDLLAVAMTRNLAAYEAAFKALQPKQRGALGVPCHTELKAIASAVVEDAEFTDITPNAEQQQQQQQQDAAQ